MQDLSLIKLNDLPITRINGIDVIICSGYKKENDNSLIRMYLRDLEHFKKDCETYDRLREEAVLDFYNLEDNAFCLNVIKDEGLCGRKIFDFFKTIGGGKPWREHEDVIRFHYNFYLTCFMKYKIGLNRKEADKFFHFYYDVDVFVRWVKEVLNNRDILSSEIERYYDVKNRHYILYKYHEFLNLKYLQSISEIRMKEFYTVWYGGERHPEEPKYIKKYSAELTFIDKIYYLVSNESEDIEKAVVFILDEVKKIV